MNDRFLGGYFSFGSFGVSGWIWKRLPRRAVAFWGYWGLFVIGGGVGFFRGVFGGFCLGGLGGFGGGGEFCGSFCLVLAVEEAKEEEGADEDAEGQDDYEGVTKEPDGKGTEELADGIEVIREVAADLLEEGRIIFNGAANLADVQVDGAVGCAVINIGELSAEGGKVRLDGQESIPDFEGGINGCGLREHIEKGGFLSLEDRYAALNIDVAAGDVILRLGIGGYDGEAVNALGEGIELIGGDA